MSTTTAGAFTDFLAKIEPTSAQWDIIVSRDAVAAKLLGEHFMGTNLPLVGTKLMGSAAKRTIIRPIDDVDILAQFDNAHNAFDLYKYDSRKFLYRVREGLAGKRIETVGSRGQAVRLFYATGGHVDIAPVFGLADGGYYLPSGGGGWISTDPFAGRDWFLKRNAELGYNLRPLVQLLKKWNRAHSLRMRSFHLETVAAAMFAKLGSNHRQNLSVFFASLERHLAVNDPGGHSGRLDGYLTATALQGLLVQAATQNTRVAQALVAEAKGDHKEAIRLWTIVLGSEFPSYG